VLPSGLTPASFTLASSTACVANDGVVANTGGGGDENGDGEHHHHHSDTQTRTTADEDGHHHHHHGGGSGGTTVVAGTPWTPATLTLLSFGTVVLTDPCPALLGLPLPGSGSGDDASARHAVEIGPPPPSGSFIVAIDSLTPTVLTNTIGPGAVVGSVYTFTPGFNGGHFFSAGHTYTFALAGPVSETPTPSLTPSPRGEHYGGDE